MTAAGRGLDIRAAIALAVVLLLAFGAAAAWAVSTGSDLARTRDALETTRASLDTTTSGLEATRGELEAITTELADQRAAVEAGEARVMTLEFQIKRKGECVASQTGNLAELRRILAIQRSNFDKTTSGSTWGKARAADDRALDLAVSNLYSAYTSAAARKYSQANTWLSRSNAQITVSNKQIAIMNREISRINGNSDAINKANDDFGATLESTASICGG